MTIPASTRSTSKRVSELLGQMTLDEKLAQIGSYYVYDLQTKGQLDQQKIEDKLKTWHWADYPPGGCIHP